MIRILTLALIFQSVLTFAQITLNPDGISYGEKDFIVIEVEGKSAKELYKNAVKYVNETYKNPNEVMRGNVEGEMMSFKTYADVNFKNMINIPGYMTYYTSLNFKDGKVKFEISDLNMKITQNSQSVLVSGSPMGGWVIYTKKGKLKQAEAKQQIESQFNKTLNDLVETLKNGGKDNDW